MANNETSFDFVGQTAGRVSKGSKRDSIFNIKKSRKDVVDISFREKVRQRFA